MDIDIMQRQLNELMKFKERAEPMLLSFEVDQMREKASRLQEGSEERQDERTQDRRREAAQAGDKDEEGKDEERGRTPAGRGR